MKPSIDAYRDQFLAQLPAGSPYPFRSYNADAWGDAPEMADELGALIANGIKTATCSAMWEWEFDGEVWDEIGHLTWVLNGRGEPLCIIEITEVSLRPFDQVDALFAFEEGEGDRSLEYWRAAHQGFFERAMEKIGRAFTTDIPLVCERFKLIYRY